MKIETTSLSLTAVLISLGALLSGCGSGYTFGAGVDTTAHANHKIPSPGDLDGVNGADNTPSPGDLDGSIGLDNKIHAVMPITTICATDTDIHPVSKVLPDLQVEQLVEDANEGVTIWARDVTGHASISNLNRSQGMNESITEVAMIAQALLKDAKVRMTPGFKIEADPFEMKKSLLTHGPIKLTASGFSAGKTYFVYGCMTDRRQTDCFMHPGSVSASGNTGIFYLGQGVLSFNSSGAPVFHTAVPTFVAMTALWGGYSTYDKTCTAENSVN